MPWKRGESGNPRGRPLGSSEVAKIRRNLAGHLPQIINALVTAAKGGDISAVKLILDRTIPVLRAEELPIALRGARGVPADMIARVIEAIAIAQIDVDRGARLVALHDTTRDRGAFGRAGAGAKPPRMRTNHEHH